MPEEEATRCSAIPATPRESLPIRCVGMLLSARWVSIQDWQPMIEKVERQLEGWKACMLSRDNCLILIKAVLFAIPIFFLSVLRATSTIQNRLTVSMCRFFWRGSWQGHVQGVALVDWKTTCRVLCEGGLGIWDIERTNLALLTKCVYWMMQPLRDLVTQVLADSYGFSIATRGASTFWKGLWSTFLIVQACFHPSLGDGSHFRF